MPVPQRRDVAVFLLLAVLAMPPAAALGIATPAVDASVDGGSDAAAGPMFAADATVPATMMEAIQEQLPAGMRIEPGTPPETVSGDALEFACPEGPAGDSATIPLVGGPPAGTQNVVVVRGQCPFRIIDEQDLLGSPQIAVRHDDPREIAFFSLHGAATTEGPTPRSRDPNGASGALSHTTFTSINEGWDWEDNPYGRNGYGETVDGIMSRDGNMFVAALFSKAVGVDEDGVGIFDYNFILQRENTVHDTQSHKGHPIDARAPGNRIEEVNLVLVKPAHTIQTQAEYEARLNATRDQVREAYRNGSTPPADEQDLGNYTIPREAEDYSDDVIVALWHERAFDYENSGTGKSSWVDMVWTDASSRDQWHKLPDEQLIGPCMDASNPVSHNGRVYVGCVVDAGYTGRRGARIGDLDVWGVDIDSEKKFYAGTVPDVSGGRPRLAANDDGRMSMTVTKLVGDGDPYISTSVQMSWGWFGGHWTRPNNVGQQLHEIWGQPVKDARITAMAMLDDPPLLYMTYMERSNTTAQDVAPDPNNPAPEANTIEYHKAVAVYDYCLGQAVSVSDLQVGIVRHPFESDILGDAADDPLGDVTGVFDDLHDGMEVVTSPFDGLQYVYFTYGDHGVIQYGILNAIAQEDASTCLAAAVPPIFTAAPPIASPLLLANGVSVGMGAAAGIPAALGLGSLLIAKRRTAMAAAVKAK